MQNDSTQKTVFNAKWLFTLRTVKSDKPQLISTRAAMFSEWRYDREFAVNLAIS